MNCEKRPELEAPAWTDYEFDITVDGQFTDNQENITIEVSNELDETTVSLTATVEEIKTPDTDTDFLGSIKISSRITLDVLKTLQEHSYLRVQLIDTDGEPQSAELRLKVCR